MTDTPEVEEDEDDDSPVTPEYLLGVYENGYFPMALDADDPELYWFSPEERGVLPLNAFNIPRGLKRAMKTHPYTITVDVDFEAVIRSCGAKTPTRDETWINETIVALYTELHRMGHAHSVEVWRKKDLSESSHPQGRPKDGEGNIPHSKVHRGAAEGLLSEQELIGGLYGVSIGGAFFGESMFSRAPDASKMALVALVEILREAGYALLDTQYVNDHLKQFGVEAVEKKHYMIKLENALSASPNPSSRFSTASVRKGFASASSLSDTLES